MKITTAFWRLFPAAIFTFLGLGWCFFWRIDPVLFAIAISLAALSCSWLVITIVEVAKTMTVTPAHSPNEDISASAVTD
jgi:hypothetical protein